MEAGMTVAEMMAARTMAASEVETEQRGETMECWDKTAVAADTVVAA